MRAIAREYNWPGVFPEEKTLESVERYTGNYAAKVEKQPV